MEPKRKKIINQILSVSSEENKKRIEDICSFIPVEFVEWCFDAFERRRLDAKAVSIYDIKLVDGEIILTMLNKDGGLYPISLSLPKPNKKTF